MNPTVDQVYRRVRRLLSDGEEVRAGGEVYRNEVLFDHFQSAYEEIFAEMENSGVQAVEATAYYLLPPFTSSFSPVAAGIANMGEPIRLHERGGVQSLPVTGATATSPINLTVVGHPFAQNQEVEVAGVQGQTGANGRWFVDIVNPDTIALRGSETAGAYTGGGYVYWSGNAFVPMRGPMHDLPRASAGSQLVTWEWTGDRFRFVGASEAVELEITYRASALAPSSGLVGILDSLNFLAHRTAASAARENGEYELAQALDTKAEGFLHTFLQKLVKILPSARPRPFRRRRHRGRGFLF
jgi:hypothetical protein